MRAVALLAAAALLPAVAAGCLVGERPPEGDADGDFLRDEVEAAGWNLTIAAEVAACFAPASRVVPSTVHVTADPRFVDTDGDGLTDGEEQQWDGDPRRTDTDGDGLLDAAERDLNVGKTLQFPGDLKLNRADSDGDCLPDGDEVNGTAVLGLGVRTTDPTARDSDGDGWDDPTELRRTRTDPRRADTDGDGASDRLDADPLRDLVLNLTFVSLRLKEGAGNVSVSFHYTFTLRGGGVLSPADPPRLAATAGQDTPVPAAGGHSPGSVDVEDNTGTGHIPFQAWVWREDAGRVVDLTPNRTEPIASLTVNPAAGAWTEAGGAAGVADGRESVLETSEARLVFRLAVGARG